MPDQRPRRDVSPFVQRTQLRQAREEAEQRQAARRIRRRRFAVASAVIIALGLLSTTFGLWLMRGTDERLSGRLSGVREITFTEGTQDDGGISPACGCFSPPVDSWRGITFAGRRASIERRGRSPWTQWVISAAEPEGIALWGGFKRLDVEAVRIRPRFDFDPSRLVQAGPDSLGEVVERATIRGYRMSLLNRGGLKVGMTGPVPVGAWIPFPGSTVRLSAARSPFPGDAAIPEIIERYPTSIGLIDGERAAEPQVYPVGDFLGPNLVLWTHDPAARIPGTAFGRPTRPGTVTPC